MDKNTSPSIVSLYDALKYFRKKELNFGDYLSTGYRQLNELIYWHHNHNVIFKPHV
jgi:hypothetical protein